jgi:hypothetical protein
VKGIFKDHKWEIRKFKNISPGFWHDQNNQREYLKWLKMKLGFKSKQDWFKVTRSNFLQNHGKGMLHFHHNSIKSIFETNFPNNEWIDSKFIQNQNRTSNSQQFLADQLSSLFPGITCVVVFVGFLCNLSELC